MKLRQLLFSVTASLFITPCQILHADGFAVDKVYHPYVHAMEQEVEWRAVLQSQESGDSRRKQLQRFGYGRNLGERWFGELYVIAEKSAGEGLDVSAYELEAIRQLTEQGEYWADWGVAFELETEEGRNAWEAATGLLMEKELGQWSLTTNFFLIQEWGKDIVDEFESRLAVQTRYRFKAEFEPALEFHSAQDTLALGPACLGNFKLGNRRNLHWELGAFAGLESDSPDYSVRAGLEFEF